MMGLTLTITETAIADTSTVVDFFWNVDAAGMASGDIDTDTPINGAPLALYPEGGPDPSIRFETPLVCFGMVAVAGRASDQYGNPQADPLVDADEFVNSTPEPPTYFARGEYAAGQQAFVFEGSPQVS